MTMSFKTYKKPILRVRGRHRSQRPRTFSSEEAAKKYADEHKINDYTLYNLTGPFAKEKKTRIVVK